MKGIRQIAQRRKAAANIGRLTRTMQVVSTARFKALHRQRTGEVDYLDALAQAGYLLVGAEASAEYPLFRKNQCGKRALLVIGSKGGLCGGYNNYIWHMVRRHVEKAKEDATQLEVVAPASRVVPLIRGRGVAVNKVYEDVAEIPTDVQIEHMAEYFVNRYTEGELDSFGVVYMSFESAGVQKPQTMTILPLSELVDYLLARAESIWPWKLAFKDFECSPSPAEMVESLAHIIVHGCIRACFVDALLSEHVARMVAMRSASKNADEMVSDLSQQYNRARQAQITAELLDIIGGTGALR